MKVLWTAVALASALVVQSALGQLAPVQASLFDPFLLVLVYCALTRGETFGMLAGGAAGWIQDIQFGGTVLGLSGLTRVLLGFGVGLAGSRFLLTSAGARTLVLLATTLADGLLLRSLAALFDVKTLGLSPPGMLARASVNAVLGVLIYAVLDRRLAGEERG
jgi:rod shape-determining protein MreD